MHVTSLMTLASVGTSCTVNLGRVVPSSAPTAHGCTMIIYIVPRVYIMVGNYDYELLIVLINATCDVHVASQLKPANRDVAPRAIRASPTYITLRIQSVFSALNLQ